MPWIWIILGLGAAGIAYKIKKSKATTSIPTKLTGQLITGPQITGPTGQLITGTGQWMGWASDGTMVAHGYKPDVPISVASIFEWQYSGGGGRSNTPTMYTLYNKQANRPANQQEWSMNFVPASPG